MKLLLLLLICLPPLYTTAQTTESSSTDKGIDARLYAVHDAVYLERVKTDNPLLLQRWTFALDNAFYITDYPMEKGIPPYQEIIVPDLKAINILLLEKQTGIHKDWQKRMVYRIKDTEKVLVYYSGQEFNEKWNDFLGRKRPDYKRAVQVSER